MDSQQDLDQFSIRDLHLSRRTFNAIHRSGVFTVGELKELFQNNRLEKIFSIGKKSIDEVSNALNEFNKEAPSLVRKEKISESTFSSSDEKVTNNIDLVPVELLHLHVSAKGTLDKNDIKTIGDLRFPTDGMLLNMNHIDPKAAIEILQILESVVNGLDKYIPQKNIGDKQTTSQGNKPTATWAEIIQSYFESEKDNHIYILLSRYGFKPKKLEEIASELNVTRERIRQIQEAVAVRFLKYVRLSNSALLLENIHEIFLEHGENLSLKKFKGLLSKENLLGEFSPSLMSERISKIDLFETLICWLILLSDSKHTQPPVEFPVEIKTLINSDSISIKD